VSRVGGVGRTRRQFIRDASATLAAWPLLGRAAGALDVSGRRVFRHGIASGDPLAERVILWTRVSPAASATAPVQVRWRVADDERLTRVVARGTALATLEADFTVKVDAGGLRPGATYYFAFDAAGEESPIGRTRTLPARGAARLRLGVVSCSDFEKGYFNAYRNLAARPDLDAVLFLGDYIYEYPTNTPGIERVAGREPEPAHECVTLGDYRLRYASHHTDPDLLALHAVHPCIAVWDDHESANDAWRDGAQRHEPGQGAWPTRRGAARRAFEEWLPMRVAPRGASPMYRRFAFGGLADVMMLDGRSFRDRQVLASDYVALTDPRRSMLGAAQEAWLYDALRQSSRGGTAWRLIGQQVLFAPFVPHVGSAQEVDSWEGYPGARSRLLDCLEHDRVSDVAVLTGDIHSSWALDLPRSPLSSYDDATGRGSLAVEIVTPAVTSSPFFSRAGARERSATFASASPHMKFMDGARHGYVTLDITAERLQADWYHVRTITERTADEEKAASFVSERGSRRVVRA
jgi:alkaline phosphatase D